ncbi:hypothetical protein ES705_27181 [subsurface metagenome]
MLNKRILTLISLLLCLFILVGCAPTVPPIGNDPPVITSNPVTDAEMGILYTYNVEANDPDGDALTYSLISNPSGMVINKYTGVITWEEPTVGSHGVKVMVSDGVLYDTQSFTVTVAPVETAAELIRIEVDPDTMALEVGGTEPFTVTAHYSSGEPQDVTTACVYDLLTTGVIEVRKGEKVVFAEGSGTDTILITYEGKTANIAVTVSVAKIPMEIILDLPTFSVGGPYWFTILMTANDDFGKLVVASFDWPTSATEGDIVGVLETDEESPLEFTLTGTEFQTDEFAMEDTIVNFRGTFTSLGTYTTTIEVRTSPGGELLCSKIITIVVKGDFLEVGDSYGGGKVAYILQPSDSDYVEGQTHGLIAATADAILAMPWSNIIAEIGIPAQGTAIGTGQENTTAIVDQVAGEITCTSGAAYYCDDLTEGGYSDWFLPSKDELNKLYDNRGVIGGFTTVLNYWSSSEFDSGKAWVEDFDFGLQNYSNKTNGYFVRPVRYF